MVEVDVKVDGIGKKFLTGEMTLAGKLHITRKFNQTKAGSAPMKVAGQILSILETYPDVQQINLNFEGCSGVTEKQMDTVKTHVRMLAESYGFNALVSYNG